MVDEVAWGVGWGAAGDGATPDVEEREIYFDTTAQEELDEYQPHNVVDSVIHDDEDDWQNEEMNSRAAMEATMRRSSSRAQRSLSRAPMLPRSTSNRSMSRHRHSRAPSPGPRSAVFINSPNVETDYDPMCSPLVSPPYYDTPSRSRSASRPRGRMLNKRRSYYPSRSPSPSIVPSTPHCVQRSRSRRHTSRARRQTNRRIAIHVRHRSLRREVGTPIGGRRPRRLWARVP
jgi:MAP/microtubule affinity-regulating kinase